MSCIYGIEQSCDECRMCKKQENSKQTNADWIRNMSNEKLVEFMSEIDNNGVITCIGEIVVLEGKREVKEWLESERD